MNGTAIGDRSRGFESNNATFDTIPGRRVDTDATVDGGGGVVGDALEHDSLIGSRSTEVGVTAIVAVELGFACGKSNDITRNTRDQESFVVTNIGVVGSGALEIDKENFVIYGKTACSGSSR